MAVCGDDHQVTRVSRVWLVATACSEDKSNRVWFVSGSYNWRRKQKKERRESISKMIALRGILNGATSLFRRRHLVEQGNARWAQGR